MRSETQSLSGKQQAPYRPGKRKRLPELKRSEWLILMGLLLLTIIPVLAGIYRLSTLIMGVEITEENARFFDSPLPVAIHIIGLIPYSILGALQFIPHLRRWKPGWHRRSGYLLIPSGLMVSISGLWMTHFYTLPAYDGGALYVIRLLVGSVMTLALCLGYIDARNRNYKAHGAWMIRAYALAVGAGTQVFTHIPWFVMFGEAIPDQLSRAIMMGTGWLINIIIAEWIIQTSLKR